MSRCRFVYPEERRIELSDGDWILVRKRLSHGDRTASYARMYVTEEGVTRPDLRQTSGLSMVTSYLVDWSLLDRDRKPVVIRDKSIEVIEAALNNLDAEDFKEIRQAVEAHEAEMNAEREAQKKIQNGEPNSLTTSTSLVGVGGH